MITASYDIALKELRAGGIVALPTETVYGLAADIRNPQAIAKIFETKMRPEFDPLIVHVSDIADTVRVVENWPPLAQKLAEAFWPGPLTMVLRRRSNINPMITSGLETVAVRLPANLKTRSLIRELGAPVAAPSANRFGHTSPTTAAHVDSEFCGEVLVLDDGPCRVGIESTVIRIDANKIQILRPGAVTAEDLAQFATVETVKNSVETPGHLQHHYMPAIPLIVLQNVRALAGLTYEHIRCQLQKQILHPAWMELPDDPTLAARLLYANMRTAAALPDVNCLFVTYPFNERRANLWAGISDRLEKAATLIV